MVGGREKGKKSSSGVYHSIMCIDKSNGEKKWSKLDQYFKWSKLKLPLSL